MKKWRVLLLGTFLILAAGTTGCGAGIDGWAGGGGVGALTFDSSYPPDGDIGVPLNVGMAAMIFPASYSFSSDISGALTLYDAGATSSLGLLPDLVADKAAGTAVAGLIPFYRAECTLLCNGTQTVYSNVAGMALAEDPSFDPCAGTWDYCRDPGAITTIDLNEGHTYTLELAGPISGTDGTTPIELAAGEVLSVSFTTPPLWRYFGSTNQRVFTEAAALPLGAFAAGGYRMNEGDYAILQLFDASGTITDERQITANEDGIPGVHDLVVVAVKHFRDASDADYLYAAIRYGDDDMGGRHGVWVARYALSQSGSGYVFGNRVSQTYNDAVGEETFWRADQLPVGSSLDSAGRLYLSQLRRLDNGIDDDFLQAYLLQFTWSGESISSASASLVGEDLTASNGFGPMAIDEDDNIYVYAYLSNGDGSTRTELVRYNTALALQARQTIANPFALGNFDLAWGADISEDEQRLYVVGSVSAEDNTTGAAALHAYSIAALKAGSGEIAGSPLAATVIMPDGYSVLHDVVVGTDNIVYVAGDARDDENDREMAVHKFDADFADNAEPIASRYGTDTCAGAAASVAKAFAETPGTHAYGLALDDYRNVFAAGYYYTGGAGDLTRMTAAWKLDRELNCDYTQP